MTSRIIALAKSTFPFVTRKLPLAKWKLHLFKSILDLSKSLVHLVTRRFHLHKWKKDECKRNFHLDKWKKDLYKSIGMNRAGGGKTGIWSYRPGIGLQRRIGDGRGGRWGEGSGIKWSTGILAGSGKGYGQDGRDTKAVANRMCWFCMAASCACQHRLGG